MMKLKKGWIFLLLGLLAALVLPACGEEQTVPEEEEEKDILIYAALNPVTNTLEKSIARFNEKHEDVQIEIHDYSDEGGRDRLQVELMLGQVPDIMELRCYGEAGEDLTGYFEVHHPGSDTGPEDGPTGSWRREDTWRTCGPILKTIRTWGGRRFWKRL